MNLRDRAVVGFPTRQQHLAGLPEPLNENDALAAHVPVPEFFECLYFFRLKIDAFLIVIQAGVGKVGADQSIFKFRAREPDIVRMHVAVAFGYDELDAGDKVEI